MLPDTDMAQFQAKGCETGTWMSSILCPSKEVPWDATKKGISMNDFIVEARIWWNIICI